MQGFGIECIIQTNNLQLYYKPNEYETEEISFSHSAYRLVWMQ